MVDQLKILTSPPSLQKKNVNHHYSSRSSRISLDGNIFLGRKINKIKILESASFGVINKSLLDNLRMINLLKGECMNQDMMGTNSSNTNVMNKETN